MNNFSKFLCNLALTVIIFSCAVMSCNKFPSGDSSMGSLSWNFSDLPATRSLSDLPDTDSFILTVVGPDGTTLYSGSYGRSPENLLVEPGNYTVRAVSREFEEPQFSAPQFGDEQVVVVGSGTDTKVKLSCTQLNSGIRFRFPSDFSSKYPSGCITVSSNEGSLTYSKSESRIGYFKPGAVSIILNDGTSENKLLSRYLEACEILTLGITCPSESSGGSDPELSSGISISVDTLRNWTYAEYKIGSNDGNEPGSSMASAYGVNTAKSHTGETGVWVCGYIVGGDLSSSKGGVSFNAPFSSVTNIAIAARASVTDKSSCMSVQLDKGSIRDALNLVENPSILGTKVYLKGDIVSAYYGIPGIQKLTDFSFMK